MSDIPFRLPINHMAYDFTCASVRRSIDLTLFANLFIALDVLLQWGYISVNYVFVTNIVFNVIIFHKWTIQQKTVKKHFLSFYCNYYIKNEIENNWFVARCFKFYLKFRPNSRKWFIKRYTFILVDVHSNNNTLDMTGAIFCPNQSKLVIY